jgi:polyhydroxyalkanoate synthesis regulator phasin
MPGFGDIVQKAFYLGVGLASYAGEKAGGKVTELRAQAQKLADEMVSRGEMNTEEAKKFVEDMMQKAQQAAQTPTETPTTSAPTEPRRIEIISEDESTTTPEQNKDVDNLRQQVMGLQEELKNLKRDK